MNTLTRTTLLIGMLALICSTVAWWQWPDGRLHVLFLETAGDAVLLQTPDGGFVLVDGGADPATLSTLLGRRMPFWQRDLEAVVLTAPDGQRLPGQLAALARYQVGMALAPPGMHASAGVTEWQRLLKNQGIAVRTARLDQQLRIGGITFKVLAVGDGDTAGLVLRIDYGRTSVMLAGAGGETDDELLLKHAQPLSALAFPWARPLPDALLDATKPRAIVFTDGFQSKHPALLTTLDRSVHGANVYHERLNGTIELVSDGVQMTVRTEK